MKQLPGTENFGRAKREEKRGDFFAQRTGSARDLVSRGAVGAVQRRLQGAWLHHSWQGFAVPTSKWATSLEMTLGNDCDTGSHSTFYPRSTRCSCVFMSPRPPGEGSSCPAVGTRNTPGLIGLPRLPAHMSLLEALGNCSTSLCLSFLLCNLRIYQYLAHKISVKIK